MLQVDILRGEPVARCGGLLPGHLPPESHCAPAERNTVLPESIWQVPDHSAACFSPQNQAATATPAAAFRRWLPLLYGQGIALACGSTAAGQRTGAWLVEEVQPTGQVPAGTMR